MITKFDQPLAPETPHSLRFGSISNENSYFAFEHLVDFNGQQGGLISRHQATSTYLQLLYGNRLHREFGELGVSKPALVLGENPAGLLIGARSDVGLDSMADAAKLTGDLYLLDWNRKRKQEAKLAVHAGSFIRFWNKIEDEDPDLNILNLRLKNSGVLLRGMSRELIARFNASNAQPVLVRHRLLTDS